MFGIQMWDFGKVFEKHVRQRYGFTFWENKVQVCLVVEFGYIWVPS